MRMNSLALLIGMAMAAEPMRAPFSDMFVANTAPKTKRHANASKKAKRRNQAAGRKAARR